MEIANRKPLEWNPVIALSMQAYMHLPVVKVNKTMVSNAATNVEVSELHHWSEQAPHNFKDLSIDEQATMIFLFNALSHNYPATPQWKVTYEEKTHVRGTWSLNAALRRGIDEGVLKPTVGELQNLDERRLSYILRGENEISDIGGRVRNVNALGDYLAQYSRGPRHPMRLHLWENEHYRDASRMLFNLVGLPMFNDVCFPRVSVNNDWLPYQTPVPMYKKAQLILTDLSHVKGWYDPYKNIDHLSCCADYKIPKALREMNILEYKPSLEDKIIRGESVQEDEMGQIRVATVAAVELLRDEMLAQGKRVNSMQLNDYLWLNAGSGGPRPIYKTDKF